MENQKQRNDHRKILLEWDSPEFIPLSRGKTWYLIAGIIMAGIIFYAIASGSITMAIAFIFISVLFMLIEHKKPRNIHIAISDMGIEHDGTFYPFHQINSFWMIYHPPYVRSMYLRISEGRRFKIIKIELDNESPIVIRELLIKEIPEIEGAQEPMLDILTRLLRLQ